ncbi:hypothetical protein GCM10009007_03380 [Formosimonas limnophila]|uniref:Uncharacterized protein n=1 Tax=Formosimonas limnophila TaxID=1384487 RepID=A0A8J3CLK3_9BURK|nr:hypothetical protein [Formosimonas limnophila]GHA66242.1 hypothetical protein GCM10009007_03380 [Formosimonas limnophila]
MRYVNYTASKRFLSVCHAKGIRLVELKTGAGELSDEEALAVVKDGKPTSEALLLAKNGYVLFDHKELTDLFNKTKKTDDPFEKPSKPVKQKADSAVSIDKAERPV